MNTPQTTRDQILAYAQKLIRQRGCNGFSYRDLAEHVGVKTSSIHYYFPSKDDLLLEAIQAYRQQVSSALRSIPDDLPADTKLDRYTDFIRQLTEGGEVCLCGMMAADFASVPEPVANEIQKFVQDNESWLTKVLAEGAAQGTLHVQGDPAVAGRAMFAALQGGGLVCRLFKTTSRLSDLVDAIRVRPKAAAGA